jgi:nucleotide-binding universal stress UspA family protein
MKTILVPVDLSAAAAPVCTAACDLARRTGAGLFLLHIVEPPAAMISDLYALQAGQVEEMLVAAAETAADRLRDLARLCTRRGVEVRTLHRLGNPVDEILARARGADLIVMGTHGHGAMYDLLVGSTTHGVLKKAPCPVLIVPPARRPARR